MTTGRMTTCRTRNGIAGLWVNGSGTVYTPAALDMFFLPQKPYMPLGSLRQQLLYPSGAHSTSRDAHFGCLWLGCQ